jgi:hypothetical protein
MKAIALIIDFPVLDRIINHLMLTFVAEKSSATSHRLSRSPDGRGDRQGILFMTSFATSRLPTS